MRKRLLATILSLALVITLLPVSAFAAVDVDTSRSYWQDNVTVSVKEHPVAPDVTEYEWIVNDKSNMNAQQVGHVMEVKLGGYADIIAGYNDYNIDAIKSGSNWGMKRPTEQAQSVENRRNVNVVGAVNGDFFNMSNGAPSGVLVMNSTVIKSTGGTAYFCVDDDDQAHIVKGGTPLPENVKEAIGGGVILVENGQIASGIDSTYGETANPRTAVGIKADGTVVIYMVDGRQAPYSVGMVYSDLAEMMLALGCVSAMNLDGGGSSMFATQREGEANNSTTAGLTIRNRPSDGYERLVSSSLLVVSKATQTGEFDHAVLSPYEEVYTPGSIVRFTASGVDIGGGAAALPESGLSWSVTGGTGLGSIDAATGVFTANADATGKVTVVLSYNGNTVGTTSIDLQWPDKLGFTNTSVSLDFGEASDLSFNPTYQGREVHYKDGDFAWTIDESASLSYKYSYPVETYTKPGWGGYTQQLLLSLVGAIGSTRMVTADYNNYRVYESNYEETSREISVDDNGTIIVSELVTHTTSSLYSHADGSLLKENITEDVNESLGGFNQKVTGIKPEQTVNFSLGTFKNNMFIADEANSFKGTLKVSLKGDSDISAFINVIVGMEPYVLMDFEGGHVDPITDKEMSAEEYWTLRVGKSEDNDTNGSLSLAERQKYRLWLRDTTNKGVEWPKNADGSDVAGLVSSEQDSSVRFGSHALKLAWDFRKISETTVAAADFGFSSMIYAHVVQPTKIGFWVNVPASLSEDMSQLKMIFVGGITEVSDTTASDAQKPNLENAYWDMDASGNLTWHPHELPKGTTQYLLYYSYDSEGNVTGSQLKDWAGKGWTWVEADLSSAQFPIGIQYGYTIRVVSPQNYTKGIGSILIDNLQLIYGTNTNDINNPVIESVSEKTASGGSALREGSSTAFSSGSLGFEAVYGDSEQTDKYASGIDVSGIHVYIDGVDKTSVATVSASSLTLAVSGLKNGSHTLKLTVKDTYGNETTKTYPFTVNDDAGENAQLSVTGQAEAPKVGGTYTLNVVNSDIAVESATVVMEVPSEYASAEMYTVSTGDGYTVASTLDAQTNQITLAISKQDGAASYAGTVTSVTFQVPETAREGDTFKYSVPMANYVTASESASFSQTEVSISLTADYKLSAGPVIAGMESVITVTDADGNPVSGAAVYRDSTQIGTTDEHGVLSCRFDTAGRVTLYAATEGGRSWNTAVVVNTRSTEGPFAVQSNASADGATTRSITWLSPIGSSADAQTLVRLAATEAGLAEAAPRTGSNELITFTETNSGTALRLNSAVLTGLTPDTTYYFQVGDGTTWSDIYSFKTASDDPAAETNFFVFGDIQTTDTSRLEAAIGKIVESGTNYAFGIQTGDAIDNTTVFSNWRPYLTVVNSKTLHGIDLVHVLGNHEYYGDADGLISKRIFSLPENEQGSFYSVEYGSVYVGVLNNGGDLLAALEEMKADAAQSDCIWKVLTLHEPIYGTEGEMNAETRLKAVELIQEAGIDFVFSGNDHTYARTYPMLSDAVTEDSQNGVVYYISGDLSSKDNAYTDHDYYAKMMPHNAYTGMYLSVQADSTRIAVTAYDYQGSLLDSYTKERTACEQGSHTFNEESRYDLTNGTISCAVCGKAVGAAESQYTGIAATTDGKQVILVSGQLKTGWITFGDTIYHAGEDGVLHSTRTVDSRTCTKGGYITTYCDDCGISQQIGDYAMPVGHQWNDDHVCTACGFEGISLDTLTINFGTVDNPRAATTVPRYSYQAGGVRPSSFATADGKTALTWSNDNTLINGNIRDVYVSWLNSNAVGEATIHYEGRGNYYGERDLSYIIVPGNVTNLAVSSAGQDSLTLKWSAAPGAGYYQVYSCDAGNTSGSRKLVATTTGTSCTVSGLESDSTYYFVAAARTEVNGTTYYSGQWSNILTAKTAAEPDSSIYITDITATVDGAEIGVQTTEDGKYLFLPASADLTDLLIAFALVDGCDEKITLSGDLGSVTLEGLCENVSIADISAKEDSGLYTVRVSVGTHPTFILTVMQASALGTLYLVSDDAAQGRDYVDASKEHETTAQMKLVSAAGNVVYNGSLSQLKARGNSTFTYCEKKSYQIKLGSKSDLLGTGEKVKTWVLLAGYDDATQMHDKFFKDLAAELGMDYVASCDWVNVYYDGEYRGVYLLSEKNSVGSAGVDITDMEDAYSGLNENYGTDMQILEGTNDYDQKFRYTGGLNEPDNITGGYLIERNLDFIDEASGFFTKKEAAFNVKSPEWAGEEAMRYISEYYQAFENAVYAVDANGNYTGYNTETGKYYYEYCDLTSLVQIFLIQELGLSPDGFRSSVYFYKDTDGIMYAGPVWDQEVTMGTGWEKYIDSSVIDYHYLAEALIRIPGFKEAVENYYTGTFAPTVKGAMAANGTIAAYWDKLEDSVAMNNMLWPLVKVGDPSNAEHLWPAETSFSDVWNTMTDWLAARVDLLDATFYKDPGNSGTEGGSGSGAGGGTISGGGSSNTGTEGGSGSGAGGGTISGGGSSNTNTTTATKKNPDGSTTTTTTDKKTGTVTETTKNTDGSTTTVETKKDGTVTETNKAANGTTGTVVTDKNGDVTEVKSTVSTKAATEAAKTGAAVTLPVEVPAAKTTEAAPAVQVTVPKGTGSVKVEVPVEKVTPGTVAVIVNADGTEKIVSTSVVTKDGVALTLDGSATVKVIDNAKDFADVPETNVFYNEISAMSARNIMIGVSNEMFDLNNSVTLNQVANVAGRITGTVDVKDFNAGIVWGNENGLKTGSMAATRGEVLMALYIAAGSPTVEDTSILSRFKDASSIPADLAAIAAWAAQNGILRGNMDGTAALGANVTRGQACALAGRTMGALA